MTWVFDAKSTELTETDADATVTLSHTAGALIDGILFAWIVYQTTSTTISGVTYGGVAMIEAINQPTNRRTALYYLTNPAAGAANIVYSGSANFGRVVVGSHSWHGAGGAQNLTGKTITGTATSANPSVTCTANNGDLIIDVLGISFTSGDTLAVDADQTERGKLTGGATTGASSSQLGSAGGVMSWTDSNSRAWGMVAAAFSPASTPIFQKHTTYFWRKR